MKSESYEHGEAVWGQSDRISFLDETPHAPTDIQPPVGSALQGVGP